MDDESSYAWVALMANDAEASSKSFISYLFNFMERHKRSCLNCVQAKSKLFLMVHSLTRGVAILRTFVRIIGNVRELCIAHRLYP